jgi:small subunit ribosomal protein S6
MVAPAPTYDLMLMLDPKAEQATRTKIRSDVKAMIEQGGTIIGDHDYGTRKMSFEIDHEANAEYDLVQFHGPNSVLEQLQRTLRITDGVTRFRIIKLRAGVGDPPDLRQEAPAAAEVVAEVEVAAEAVEGAAIEEAVEEAVIEAVVEEAVAEEIVDEAIAEVATEEAVAEAQADDDTAPAA